MSDDELAPPPAPAPEPTKRKRRVTAAVIAANRTRAWRHGRRAKVVTEAEAMRARLRQLHPGAPEILDRIIQVALGGMVDEASILTARSTLEQELLRAAAVDKIHQDGLTVEDQMLDRDGKVYGVRTRAHPLLEHVVKLSGSVNSNLEAMQATNKSRGEGRREDEVAKILRARREMLLAIPESQRRLPPPPDPLDGDDPDGEFVEDAEIVTDNTDPSSQ